MKRVFSNDRYTISHIYAYGVYVCDAIEDTDRGWNSGMSDAWIRNNKVYAKSAIPVGTYEVTLNVVSPKFVQKDYYKKFCGSDTADCMSHRNRNILCQGGFSAARILLPTNQLLRPHSCDLS